MKRHIGVLAAAVMSFSATSALAGPVAVEDVPAPAPQETERPFADTPDQNFGPVLIPAPQQNPTPEIAVFTVEEAAAPFLGPATGVGARVLIAVEAEGYSDLFTVYFPRGSAHLTLPAGDMVAMAAEAVRGLEGVRIWISAESALTAELAATRTGAVEDILLQNDVPESWIHLDDGSIDAILNRPDSLADDLAL